MTGQAHSGVKKMYFQIQGITFTFSLIDRNRTIYKDCNQGVSKRLTFPVTFGGFEINISDEHLH